MKKQVKKQTTSSSKKRQRSKSHEIADLYQLIKEFVSDSIKKVQKQIKKSAKSSKPKNKSKKLSLAPRLFQEYLKLDTQTIVVGGVLILLIIIFSSQISKKHHIRNLQNEYSNLLQTAQKLSSQNDLKKYIPVPPPSNPRIIPLGPPEDEKTKYKPPVKTRRPVKTDNQGPSFSLQDLNIPRDLPPGVKGPDADFSGAVKMVQKALAQGKMLEEVMAG